MKIEAFEIPDVPRFVEGMGMDRADVPDYKVLHEPFLIIVTQSNSTRKYY